VPHLAPYARKFPDVQFIIDHCGVAFDAQRGAASLDDTIALAEHPNVALKWAHAPAFLSTAAYPFPDLEPKLARALDGLRPRTNPVGQRLQPSAATRHNWAESLFSIRHSPTLSHRQGMDLGPHDQDIVELGRRRKRPSPTSRCIRIGWAGCSD